MNSNLNWAIPCCLISLFSLLACEAIVGIPDRETSDNVRPKGDAGPDGSVGSSCKNFCTKVNKTCTGQYAIYHGEDCEPACEYLSEDQVQCRDEEVNKAALGDFHLHCQAASLGGAKECGTNCRNYCNIMAQVCQGTNRDAMEIENCETKCSALIDRDDLKPANATQSRYNVNNGFDHEGDTIQCRLVHLTIAAQDASFAKNHCWHAWIAPRPLSGSTEIPPCATTADKGIEPRCEDHCHLISKACTGNNAQYEDNDQCLAACERLPKGDVSTPSGNTGACRKIHAYNALVYEGGAGAHCPHAGPAGDKVCGDNDCVPYCQLLSGSCPETFKGKWGSGTDASNKCVMDCNARIGKDPLHYTVESAKAKTSNPIACGILNAVRAFKKPDDAMLCDAALGNGECKR